MLQDSYNYGYSLEDGSLETLIIQIRLHSFPG